MRKFMCWCAAALLPLLAACRMIDSGERGFSAIPDGEHSALLQESTRLGNGILKSFQDGDFVALRRNMPGELGEHMMEKDFSASCRNFREKFGEIRDFRLLTDLATPAFGNLIWVVTFVRAGTNGAEIRRQLLFRLVTIRVDGNTQVVSCGFL